MKKIIIFATISIMILIWYIALMIVGNNYWHSYLGMTLRDKCWQLGGEASGSITLFFNPKIECKINLFP